MSTKELIHNCEASRIASNAAPKDKILQDHYDNSYRALFSAERMSNMLRSAENAVPGIRHSDVNGNFTPVSWDFWPKTFHAKLPKVNIHNEGYYN